MTTPSGVMLHRKVLAVLMVLGLSFAPRPSLAQQCPCPNGPSDSDPKVDAVLKEFDACGNSDEVCMPPRPFLYFRADGVMLHRNVTNPVDVASLGTTNPRAIVLSTRSFDEPFKAGAKFTIGHTFVDTPYQIEFSYLLLDSWDETAAVRNGAANLQSVFTRFGLPNIPTFDNNTYVRIHENSFMETGELNLRRTLPTDTDNFAASFLVGIRHLGLHEGFGYESRNIFGTVGVDTGTRNDLWGPQIGGLFEFYCQKGMWVNCDVKAALCNNNMTQDTKTSVTTTEYHRVTNGTAGLIDVDVAVVYRPAAHITTRVGYQAMWMTGVALASRNFCPDYSTLQLGPEWLDTQGQVLYHGPHIGLEVDW